ncbi:MAG: [FeFe] hydrogenase H-cluster radical SAM maturase HydG [Elusimicrobia bacterium]|nr:[FeFe] hydrogenase H-cluster radical SAM maturase HydG [Elusimicrobiota bacterium]MBU2614402.1 [FeFe] hydrogenase H-cluster radical SAM maturase HydG [Elusimicrobiota bacterium]
MSQKIIDESLINGILNKTQKPSSSKIRKILKKASQKNGLTLDDAGYLVNLKDRRLIKELFKVASNIKNEIYGERLVFFAPLYISDYCVNDCQYCNFHKENKEFKRKRLSFDEIGEQVKHLINTGHKRVLLELGEDPDNNTIDYVVKAIEKIYSVKTPKGNIRRINVNIAATTVENYRRLKEAKIGTYQLFQETYRRETFNKLHQGPKADYDRQVTAHTRAFKAGIDDVGLGVLFGLYDWRFEVLGLISHSKYLDKQYGVGPHTISVPRFRPAPGVTYKPEYKVSDNDFLKLIAILRLAVPYTGMIISTRESAQIRKKAFQIGISQASAASVTVVGGYGKGKLNGQFEISDERPLKEVIKNILKDKLLPSFCTACYRLGRTGEHFMELSKPGEIHKFCRPNGLLTFAEYLEDFAKTNGTYKLGNKVIKHYLEKIENRGMRDEVKEKLEKILKGERDLYF